MTLPNSWLERLCLLLILVILGWGFVASFSYVAPVLSPVLVSLLIAYFLDPLIDRIETWRLFGRPISRAFAILVVATVLLGGVVAFFALLVPTLVGEVATALERLPGWAMARYEQLRVWMSESYHIQIDDQVSQWTTAISERAQELAVGVGRQTLDGVTTLLNLVLIPIFTWYFLYDFDRLKLAPLALVPPWMRDGVRTRAARMDEQVGNWVRGQVQVAMILAVLYGVGLGLIGIKMGILIGIVAGLLNVVPYLGAGIGFALAFLMGAIHGDQPLLTTVLVVVVFSVIQLLESYVITPRLVGTKLGMSPLTVMVVLLVGGSLFGFFGLLLALPAVAAGSVVLREANEWLQQTAWWSPPVAVPAQEAPQLDLDAAPDDGPTG